MSKDLNPQIRNAFNKIICDSDFQELSSALNKTCLFEILTIERKEVIFTKVLSWLLDPSAEHDMKGQALKRFMHLCLSKYNDVDPELCRKMIDSFSIEDIDFDCVKVSAEKLTEVGRFDVYAELDQGSDQKDPKSQRAQPLLIIEAKIDALQSDGQTEKYKEWAEKNYIDKMPIMVYLTPKEQEEKVASGFIQMSFQELHEWLLELKQATTSYYALLLIDEIIKRDVKSLRVPSPDIKNLIDRLSSRFKDTITELNSASLPSLPNQLKKYEAAFNALALTFKSNSKGYSETIHQLRSRLGDALKANDKWLITGGEGSITINYVPLDLYFRDELLIDVASPNFWLDRNMSYVNLAFYGRAPAEYSTQEWADIRKGFTVSLRKTFSSDSRFSDLICKGDSFQVLRLPMPKSKDVLTSEDLSCIDATVEKLINASHIFEKWIESKPSLLNRTFHE